MKLILEGPKMSLSPARRITIEEECETWDADTIVDEFQNLMLAWGYPADVIDGAFLTACRVNLNADERHKMMNRDPA